VIIVTPYIVRPVSTRLALPTDGFIPPTDVDRIFFGRNYVQQTGRGRTGPAATNNQGLVGPAGFVLD
jgi:pilus assembly protein CpaC